MATNSKACLRCRQEHEEPTVAYLIDGNSRCIRELSRKIEELEQRLNEIGKMARDAAIHTTRF